ncbi:hypothetical protein ACIOGZ_28985 [Kitasatospora sp. NPDC088160]|uniref:hypothetical protein n=1 Tax=Kitasatospora sp. NPDC088160 TaxID=3364072 RepID=UPI00382E8FAF
MHLIELFPVVVARTGSIRCSLRRSPGLCVARAGDVKAGDLVIAAAIAPRRGRTLLRTDYFTGGPHAANPRTCTVTDDPADGLVILSDSTPATSIPRPADALVLILPFRGNRTMEWAQAKALAMGEPLPARPLDTWSPASIRNYLETGDYLVAEAVDTDRPLVEGPR